MARLIFFSIIVSMIVLISYIELNAYKLGFAPPSVKLEHRDNYTHLIGASYNHVGTYVQPKYNQSLYQHEHPNIWRSEFGSPRN